MKKIKFTLLIVLMMTILSSCTCEHNTGRVLQAVEATCEERGKTAGFQCSDCGEILTVQEDIAPLGHTTETGVCSRCGKNFSNWEIRDYKDVFGDLTGEQFVGNVDLIQGTFSNSATSNSKLEVFFRIDKEDISLILWEYGSHQVKNSYSKSKEYDITIKTSAGKKVYVSGRMYSDSGVLYISYGAYSSDEENIKKVLTAFCENDSVTFLIEESDRRTTSYIFTVNTEGFEEIYNLLK